MRVDRYMKDYKLLVRDIAYYCGVSRQAVSAWRSGEYTASASRWYKFIAIEKILAGKDIRWRGQALEFLGFPRGYK